MTVTGLILIPLSFLIIMLPWRYSLLALPLLGTLNDAAVVNLGAFGLQPGYFFGLLIIARTAVEIAVLRVPLNPQVIRLLAPLLLFTIIAVASIWIGLAFFQGKVTVMTGTDGFNLDLAGPYRFQRQNLTQPFYLLLNGAIVLAVAQQIARLPAARVGTTLDRAVLIAIAFASAVAIWEMASFYYGVPFASDFFHSNAGYFAAYGQVLSGTILRVSGPFAEPSALAYYFAAFLLYAWYRYLHQPSIGMMSVILLCIALMLASTSTTAFVVLGLFALIVAKDLSLALCTTRTTVKLSPHQIGALALVIVAVIAGYGFLQDHWHEADAVLTSMLFEKQYSSSFAQRSGADMMALDILLQTGGLGIGLGSHKPNNLVMSLLSNTGVAGTLAFAAFLFGLLRPRREIAPGVDARPLQGMAVGLLLVHLVSNPNLNPVILWVSFAFVIGVLAAQTERQVHLLGQPLIGALRL